MNDQRVPKKQSGAPLPGAGVRGSATGRPIMALLDLLGRRWALRILKELRAAQLVERAADGYALTPLGARLLALMLPLDRWAKGWAKALEGTTPG